MMDRWNVTKPEKPPAANWTADELKALAEGLRIDESRKWRQRPMPASPHGATSESLADFRGLPFGGAVRMDIVDADLSGASSVRNEHGVDMGLSLHSCRCARVRFD